MSKKCHPQVFLKEIKYTSKEKNKANTLIMTYKVLLMNRSLIKNRLINSAMQGFSHT